jgi:heat shock protein HslJ
MKKLLIILASIFLVSCGVIGTKNAVLEINQDKRILLNDIWKVLTIKGSDIDIKPESDGIEIPVLEINLSAMEYFGSDGCNRYKGGIVELDDEHIRFGMASATRRMCQQMKIPDEFNRILPLVTSYKQKGLTLWLLNQEGEELMKLEKSDQDRKK